MSGRTPRPSSAVQSRFTPGEYVRIVPLHYPKPAYSTDDLGREGQDLFDGQPHPARLDAQLTYRGGPLIPGVEVFTVFWGKLWGTTARSNMLITQINQFFTDILHSPMIDQLGEYSVPGQTIGHGSFTGTRQVTASAPSRSITDSAVQKELRSWIAAKTVPKTTKNSLTFIYLDPGVVSVMGGSRSCQSYCGYHDHAGAAYYAVLPYPSCAGCLGGLPLVDALTATSSHELCESITDPAPGRGWYDDTNGEIGDICAWQFKRVAGHNVQKEWSNQQRKCV
jgi:hypothetical protein